MAQYLFGSGALWGVRTDVANATPRKFGALQDVSIDISGSLKHLYGQGQYPLAIARGQSKITGKAKFSQIQGSIFNDLFLGASSTTGQTLTANSEAAAVPASSPYSVTVANSATFKGDLGVMYAATGLPLTKVAASPTVGQYSVTSGGVYSFNASDSGAGLLISYTYTIASGQTLTLGNPYTGTQPVFSVTLETLYGGLAGQRKAVLTLNACVSGKLALATKHDDFIVPELDFEAHADVAGNVFSWSFAEVA